MKRIALKVDSNGRIHIPKECPSSSWYKTRVSATMKEAMIKVEQVESILGRHRNQ